MSQPLKIRFATDVEGAKQGMANLAASVANNALQMSSALKAANDNVQRLQSLMNGLSTARAAFLPLAGAAVAAAAAVALVSSAVEQAHAQLDRFIKLGENADRAGVGVEFFQRFTEAAEKAKISTGDVEAALKKAGSTVTPKFEQEDAVRKQLERLVEYRYVESSQLKGLSSYNNAGNNEERIRAAVKAMQELRDLGLQVAAVDIGEKLFGAEIADRIRTGKLDIDAIAASLDRQRDDLVTQEEVDRANDFKDRLDAAYKAIDDFFHVSVALEGTGRAVLDIWLGIAEGVASATKNAGNFYTKIQEMQGPLANYLQTVGLIVSGTAKIFAGGLNDQADGARTLYDKPIGPEPGAPRGKPIDNAPAPPTRPASFAIDPPTKGGRSSKPASTTESLDQVQTYLNGLERTTAALKAEMDALGKSNIERQTAINLAKAEELARQNNIKLTDVQIARIKETSRATAEYRDTIEDAHQRQSDLRSIGTSVFQGIRGDFQAGVTAGQAFLNVLGRIGDKIGDLAVNGLVDSLFGKTGGTDGGFLGKAFSTLLGSFAGGKAGGGDITAGQWALVGENGPELIGAASMARTVVPNGGKLVAGAGGSQRPGGTMNYTNAPTYNIRPAEGVTIPQLRLELARHDAEITRTMGQRLSRWKEDN